MGAAVLARWVFGVHRGVESLAFKKVDCRVSKDVLDTAEVVEGCFGASDEVITDDFIILLVRRPTYLALLFSGDFCSLNFAAAEESFVFGYSIE